MGFLAAAGGWFVSLFLKVVSSKWLKEALAILAKTDDGLARLAEIDAQMAIALKKEDTKQYADWLASLDARQQRKMNQPVFWTIILIMIGAPALIIWSVALYNIFWWQHGIWPQPWAIADFPSSIKPWVQASIDWLYDPMGPPGTVAAAGIASYLVGGRKR